MIGYCKTAEEIVDTFAEYEKRAKELVTEGYTEVLICDEPKKLLHGYLFDSPSNLQGCITLMISIEKDGVPRQVFPKRVEERMELARSWGSTLPI